MISAAPRFVSGLGIRDSGLGIRLPRRCELEIRAPSPETRAPSRCLDGYGTSVAAGLISAAETGLASRLASVAKKRMNSARPRAAPMVRPADIEKPPMESSARERGKPYAPAGARCKP